MLAKNKVKNMRDEVYANNSSIEFVHMILIHMGNDQTISICFSTIALTIQNNVNTLSAHGLENSKACNKR